MKDRIPKDPGRVLITPENGGAPFYATMTRADNPEQEGTPLNKNSLLKDETAALFGLGTDALPDDVLALLPAKIDGVDIKNLVIEKITESVTWRAPAAVNQHFEVFAVGGGGSGGYAGTSSNANGAGGGGSGYVARSEFVIPEGTEITVTVGAGGAKVTSVGNGVNGGKTSFGTLLTAAGGKGGYYNSSLADGEKAAGGAGNAGGGAGSVQSYGSRGGAGGTYGGGGGGSGQNFAGGAGGTYGGGGGSAGVSNTNTADAAAIGGTYGGAGGRRTDGAIGTPKGFDPVTCLFAAEKVFTTGAGGIGYTNGGGGGGGGYGGVGGNGTAGSSIYAAGGGGGGFGSRGGDGYGQFGAGGGGGYFGNGGNGANRSGGGGGGFFCKGGDAGTYGGGGGGGFFADGATASSTAESGAGGAGGCLIIYFKED